MTDQPDFVLADVEIFSNYFLLALKNHRNGKKVFFEKSQYHDFDRQELLDILKRYRIVTFNGINFDMPIIAMAIAGKSVFEMKVAADRIILGNMRPWIFERSFGVSIPNFNHIDLIEVAPLKASLKTYNGRLHGRRMQDLPIEPDQTLSQEEMDIVRDYCFNDLEATGVLLDACMEPLILREQMSKDYKIELRSKSDAQVAEAVIKAELERELGRILKRDDCVEYPDSFRYKIPSWMSFKTPALHGILERLKTYDFEVQHNGSVAFPEFLKDPVMIGDGAYRVGIGGLHSSEERVHYKSCDKFVLIDRDVASYYPNLILTQRLAPKQFGEAFLTVYKKIVDRRLEAKGKAKTLKKEGKKKEASIFALIADSLKIAINGSFGKLGSIYSLLFAPDLMIQVTLSGQLYLLMLIEKMEECGFKVCSANTDGFVTLVERERQDEFNRWIKEWETITGLETEETIYKAIYNRDVNNYVAIKEDSTTKGKGAFNNPIEDNDNLDFRSMMQKNPECVICVEAATKFLVDGTPVEQTIRECKDMRKFVSVRNVTGGGVYDGEYLGKAVRWYYGHTSAGTITYKKNGNKVPKSDGCVPLMLMDGAMPLDLDFDFYIASANELLIDLSHYAMIDNKNWYFKFIKEAVKPSPKSRNRRAA